MANTFTYNYKPLDYATAQKQAAQQVDPLYNRAIQGVQQQKYTNDQQAGQVAAAHGMGHSGLAADQLNKIAIAAQGNVADLNAQRATQIAQQANDNVWQDKNYSLQNRAQLYNEFNSNRSYDYQTGRDKIADTRYNNEWAYQKGRDKVSDNQWNKQYNRGVLESDRNYNYQKGVDTRNFNYQKSQDSWNKSWQKYQYNHMSASDKAQLDWAKKQYGEDAAWRMYELKYNGNLQKSLADFSNNSEGVGTSTSSSKDLSKYAGYNSFQKNMNAAVKKGVPKEWVPLLTEIVKRESSFNPGAKNPSSTAYGYGQFLSSTRSNYEKKTGLSYDDPVNQLVMMAQYVKDRYGTPAKAVAFWNKNHWY